MSARMPAAITTSATVAASATSAATTTLLLLCFSRKACPLSTLASLRHPTLLPVTGEIVQSSTSPPPSPSPSPVEIKQGTEEWHELRQSRLTASSFSTALGFWGVERRAEFWEEKVGLREKFSGNPATEWGTTQEACAIQRYQEVTGNTVESMGFKIYKEEDDVQGWMGASPDGLIHSSPLSNEKEGILEVKCPYNKGKPEQCVPWMSAPYYYMPQMQGLMEILDRDWLDLFVWTLNGFSIFRVDRDAKYWALMYGVLSDFWWASVVPAKQSLLLQKNVDVNIFRPSGLHRMTDVIVNESKRLASKAPLIQKQLLINKP